MTSNKFQLKETVNGFTVSTVKIGNDYETLVFDSCLDEVAELHASSELEAEQNHKSMVSKYRKTSPYIVTAGELKVGFQVAEADGFLFDVVEVVKETAKTITVRLCSDFSSFKSHWTVKPDGTPGGVLKTFRKSTKIYAIV
ncbi:MAG: hypothetical protein HFI80_10785 [Lachnospiraceae bacterium]|jgi:hypothetical protein|nr:hypothetical protein [Lachnospiraceae bacterium]MCI9662002.1 hypothetical protein [Lachnospiraceae bacterium]